MKRVVWLAIFSMAMVALNTEASAGCWGPTVLMAKNGTVDNSVQVTAGTECRLQSRSGGPLYSVDIVQRPSHGTVRIGPINSVIYAARAGYIGNDSFSFVRRGRTAAGEPAAYTVRMAVTVTP
jgi:hypothetical protein